jgi:hypothetical protein
MRTFIAMLTAAALWGSLASAEEVRERRVVYLNGPEAMAELEKTNPRHYEIARLILASGPKLCEPGAPRVYQLHMGADEITCSNFLLRTSNPPKKQISFELEDAVYIALIVVEGSDPTVIPAK